MAPSKPSKTSKKDKDSGISGVRKSGGDAVQMTIDYVKQETLGPIKGLIRFVGIGSAGSLAIAIGLFLMLIGVLRVLQDETGSHLTGHLSWVPYFVVSLLALAIVGLAAWRITAGPAERKLPRVKDAHIEEVSSPLGQTEAEEGSS